MPLSIDQEPSEKIVLDIPAPFRPFLEPARFKISWGGRGGAKSYSIAMMLVYIGYADRKKILCAREFQNSLKESAKALIEEMIIHLGLSWFYKVTETEIEGLNGTIFIFKGLRLNVGSLNSLVGIDICWLEEAQNNSRVSINALFPTIRKKGSEIWVSMNPRKKTDPIYDMFLTGQHPPNSILVNVNYYDNPWFSETALVQDMEWDKARDPAKYRHVWLGELEQRSDAIVFTNWRKSILDVPDSARPIYGADWGFSVDPTVLVKAYLFSEERILYIEKEAYAHKVEIDDLSELFERIPGSRFNVITADNARPELIQHMRKDNWRIQASIKGKNSVIEGIEFMRNHDIVVHPSCVHTVNELENYKYDIDKEGVILANLVDENNHCIDAIRYALEAKRRGQMKITSRAIP